MSLGPLRRDPITTGPAGFARARPATPEPGPTAVVTATSVDVVPDDVPPVPRAHSAAAPAPLELGTRHGAAVAHVHGPAAGSRAGVLVLGHGAGGGVGAPDLVGVTAAAVGLGWTVVLVEQPYRAAGRRVGPRPAVLDEAWCDVVQALRDRRVGGLDEVGAGALLVTGGRSAGARVACRTATLTGAAGVVALAFPTQPPGRSDRPSRVPELASVGVPVLVVQGATDPYGIPPAAPDRDVVVVPGDHGLKKDVPAVADAVVSWLALRSR